MRYEQATAVAELAHRGQLREAEGLPYIVHPIRVAEACGDEETKVAAVLHDVLEDTDMTREQLKEAGASEVVLQALDLLTRRPGEVYMAQFIERIATAPGRAGEIAREVKRADLRDNLAGVANLPEEKRSIERRYRRALARLER